MATEPNLHKADFGPIYNQPDPRAYYRTLGQHDYRIPEHGATIYRRLLAEKSGNAAASVLDVCCSYGILAGLLKTRRSLDDLYRHYRDGELDSLDTEQIAEADAKYFAEHQTADCPYVVGLDIAEQAVNYAVDANVLDEGFVENLETSQPSARLTKRMADVDLIVTTGGIGYVTEQTFTRLLASAKPSVWVAAFCLRTYDYDPISQALERHGLRTEQATRTFEQRKFVGADEQHWATAQVREWGLDPAGFEDDGYYHANFYLARPVADVERRPASTLLPDTFA